jgi:hypothetical protein
MAPTHKWLRLFEMFVSDIRIASKEFVSGVGPLKLWDSQRRFLKEVGEGLDSGIHEFYCLKSRQQGMTTISLAISTFWLAMHDNMIAALVTDDEPNREANRNLITTYVNSFDEGYFGGSFKIEASNRQMMRFSNGAVLRFLVAGTKKKGLSWAEGTGYSMLHCTEVAKYADENAKGLESLLESFAQTNPNRLIIMESTANGFNHWKRRWQSAQDNYLTQRAFFIGWWAVDTNRIDRSDPRFLAHGTLRPTYDEKGKILAVKQHYDWEITAEQLAWIRWKESKAGQEQELLQQNNPWTADEAFVESGHSFFATRMLNKDVKRIEDSPSIYGMNLGVNPYVYKAYRYEANDDFFSFSMERLHNIEDIDQAELRVWEEPKPGGKYAIGFDVAYGRNDHKDGNVVTVFRCFADKMVQVAEYATYGTDVRYASWAFFHLCAAYDDVMGNIDVGGPGRLVMMEFKHLRELLGAEHNQQKVKEREWEDANANARYYLYHKPDSLGKGYIYNFETNWSTKPRLMHAFRSAYITHEIEIRSRKLLDEMLIVRVDEDGYIGAPESSDVDAKDDRVFAAALAHLAWFDWIKGDMLGRNETYENVMKEQDAPTPLKTKNVNNLVYRWLNRQEELANEEPPRGTDWQIQNGLV